jgi:predicted transcriptional regulator
MKQHNGIRPQDIVILLKISAKGNLNWQMKDLASELGISAGEVSESLNRSTIAGFIASDKRKLMKSALLEFLKHGLKYVYPQKPGALFRGMPTAHSYSPLNEMIKSEEAYVWQWADGTVRGQSIAPLHPSVPKACSIDNKLHELLALIDSIRVGKAREQNLAIVELEKRILDK